jgi:hypothetical protein
MEDAYAVGEYAHALLNHNCRPGDVLSAIERLRAVFSVAVVRIGQLSSGGPPRDKHGKFS